MLYIYISKHEIKTARNLKGPQPLRRDRRRNEVDQGAQSTR